MSHKPNWSLSIRPRSPDLFALKDLTLKSNKNGMLRLIVSNMRSRVYLSGLQYIIWIVVLIRDMQYSGLSTRPGRSCSMLGMGGMKSSRPSGPGATLF